MRYRYASEKSRWPRCRRSGGQKWRRCCMTLIEIIDRQKSVIQEQAAVIAELASMIEQARLTGPGVEIAKVKMREVNEALDKIEAGSRPYFNTGVMENTPDGRRGSL